MRPRRNTILELSLPNGQQEQIFEPEDNYLYVITYQQRPIGIRVRDPRGWNLTKYKNTVYPNRGYADVTARRLNQRYNTDQFCVIALKIN